MTLDIRHLDPDGEAGDIIIEALIELRRAERKFPDQVLPDWTSILGRGPDGGRRSSLVPSANVARGVCQAKHAAGCCSWADVLIEEVCEAVDEAAMNAGSPALRDELIQVIAVAMRWIKQIHREWQAEGDETEREAFTFEDDGE